MVEAAAAFAMVCVGIMALAVTVFIILDNWR